jgi:hypothetical protein
MRAVRHHLTDTQKALRLAQYYTNIYYNNKIKFVPTSSPVSFLLKFNSIPSMKNLLASCALAALSGAGAFDQLPIISETMANSYNFLIHGDWVGVITMYNCCCCSIFPLLRIHSVPSSSYNIYAHQ